jgi:hypothetical protein
MNTGCGIQLLKGSHYLFSLKFSTYFKDQSQEIYKGIVFQEFQRSSRKPQWPSAISSEQANTNEQ